MNKLGDFIKSKREELGLSLREFAKRCDLSHSYIDNIEKGYDTKTLKPVSPTLDTLTKLSKGLSIPVSDLMLEVGIGGFVQTTKSVTFNDNDLLYNITARSSSLPEEIRNHFISISENQLQQFEVNFGKKVKELRTKRNLTQKQFSQLFDIQIKTLEELEQGKHPVPSQTFVEKVSQYFEISTSELFGLKNSITPIIEPFAGVGLVNKDALLKQLLTPQELEVLELAKKNKYSGLVAKDLSKNHTSHFPLLNPKDEREITRDLEIMLNSLDDKTGMAAYNDTEDEEDRELLKASLLTSMKLAKQIAKKKFTPKKYREE